MRNSLSLVISGNGSCFSGKQASKQGTGYMCPPGKVTFLCVTSDRAGELLDVGWSAAEVVVQWSLSLAYQRGREHNWWLQHPRLHGFEQSFLPVGFWVWLALARPRRADGNVKWCYLLQRVNQVTDSARCCWSGVTLSVTGGWRKPGKEDTGMANWREGLNFTLVV